MLAVHPRACGEHERPSSQHESPIGSSPRLRGTSDIPRAGRALLRFIPAPAGNMPAAAARAAAGAVHPRACGEHTDKDSMRSSSRGSSPRLRGTLGLQLINFFLNRFIPAPAGNILTSRKILWDYSVHPRACGEHTRLGALVFLCPGSSPRLRGTFLSRNGHYKDLRFIPAPAGNICHFHGGCL